MACSSVSVNTLGYTSCIRTLQHLVSSFPPVRFQKYDEAIDSPLNRCMYLINQRILDLQTVPIVHYGGSPSLNPTCKTLLWQRLITPIPLGLSTITLLQFFLKLQKSVNPEKWDYWDTLLVGSDLPLNPEFWNEFLSIFTPNIDAAIYSLFVKTLCFKTLQKRNWDVLVRVGLNSVYDREDFEASVWGVFFELVNLTEHKVSSTELREYVRMSRPSEFCTTFVIDNPSKQFSIDITIWYAPRGCGLPELFTQQGACLPIHRLLNMGPHQWQEPILLGLTAPSSSMFLSDRCSNIIRFTPTDFSKAKGNFGLFRRLMVMMTKGGLCPQEALDQMLVNIYWEKEKSESIVLFDLKKCHVDHLPETLGSLVALWINWLAVLRQYSLTEDQKNKTAQIEKGLAQHLQFPCDDSTSEHLRLTYDFLKNTPGNFEILLRVLDFAILVSYLKMPEKIITRGLWKGVLSLRLPLDGTKASFVQRPIAVANSLSTIIDLLSKGAEKTLEEASAIEVLYAYLDHFEIMEPFDIDPQTLLFLNEKGDFNDLFIKIWKLLFSNLFEDSPIQTPIKSSGMDEEPELIAESSQPEPHKVQAKKIVPLKQLVEKNNWMAVKRRLFRTGLTDPEKRDRPVFGNALWALFNVWNQAWKKAQPTAEARREMLQLFSFYAKALKNTVTPEKSELLYNLIKNGFKQERQQKIVFKHEESGLGLLLPAHIKELLMPENFECFDAHLLKQMHSLLPDRAVVDCVAGRLRAKQLPPYERLVGMVQFMKEVDNVLLSSMERQVVNRLINENRVQELFDCEFSVDVISVFKEIFHQKVEKGHYEKAHEILSLWNQYHQVEHVKEELDLLEAEARHTKRSHTVVKQALAIHGAFQNREQEIRDRAFALCLLLATRTLKLDAMTMGELWEIFHEDKRGVLASLSLDKWMVLLKNIKDSGDINSLWHALHAVLQHTRTWNSDIQETFKNVLKLGVRKKKSRGNGLEGRNGHLLPILSQLEGRISWHENLANKDDITPLVITNLAAMIVFDSAKRNYARAVGQSIIDTVKLYPLTVQEETHLETLEALFHNRQIVRIPSKSVLRRQQRPTRIWDVSPKTYVILATVFTIAAVCARVFMWKTDTPELTQRFQMDQTRWSFLGGEGLPEDHPYVTNPYKMWVRANGNEYYCYPNDISQCVPARELLQLLASLIKEYNELNRLS